MYRNTRYTIKGKSFSVEQHSEPEYSVVLNTPNGNECFEYDNKDDADRDYSTIKTVLQHVYDSLV